MAEHNNEKTVERAETTAQKAEAQAIEARRKIDEEAKTAAQKAADQADAKADDARAAAEQAKREEKGSIGPTSVDEARVLAPVDRQRPAGDHHAQKFGNDPENPIFAPGLDAEDRSVLLSRKTPDHPDLVYATVHPDMVGDYLRAGWNRDLGGR